MMMSKFLLAAVVATAALSVVLAGGRGHSRHSVGPAMPAVNRDAHRFELWMSTYRPEGYASPAEHQTRFEAFRATLRRLEVRSASKAGAAEYGLNRFSDWTTAEYKALLTYRAPRDPTELPQFAVANDGRTHHVRGQPLHSRRPASAVPDAEPDTFDWRDKGAISFVKDQGQCGSCWAFSAVETLESFWFLSPNGTLPTLSPQQVVDCNLAFPDMGCNGGTTQFAYEYIMKVGGLDSEEEYPYTSGDDGQRGFCLFDKKGVQANVKSWSYATPVCADLSCNNQNENTMQQALVANGPVSVCLNADAWQDYVNGVMDGTDCGGHSLLDLDHCVQTVGYNKTAVPPYWIVRNSWNTNWGIDGYIYLAMGNNTCGIANIATQITVAPL